MSITAYLFNRCPTKKLKNIKPKESWSRFKSNMSHIRMFCLVAYRHVLYQLIKKLDGKGEQMILVRYHSMGGYKPYDTINKRIIIIKDMSFYELRDWQHAVTDYHHTVTNYTNAEILHVVFEGPETTAGELQVEENVIGSVRQRGLSARLQNCKLFLNNEVNYNSDLVYFTLMDESKLVKMEEVLSDPKWICAIKEEHESIEK